MRTIIDLRIYQKIFVAWFDREIYLAIYHDTFNTKSTQAF